VVNPGGTRRGVAPAGVPPLATTPAFSRHERRRQTSLGGERWWIDDPVFMLFSIHIYVNVNNFYNISIHILCKRLLILCSVL
jgi:hypothetical protein